jgi:hypothetical protein
VDKANIRKLNEKARSAMNDLLAGNATGLQHQIDANNALITQYTQQRDRLQGSTTSTKDIQDTFAAEAGIGPAGPDVPTKVKPGEEPNFWTSISLEVSSSYTAEQSSSTSTSMSARAGYSFGQVLNSSQLYAFS